MKPDRATLDLLSCRDRLAEIAPELERDGGRPDLHAELAIILGRCLLFGVAASPALLSPAQADCAAATLLSRVPGTVQRVRALKQLWDESEEIDEAVSASAVLLEDRLDVWAACEALEAVASRNDADIPEALKVSLDSRVSQLWEAIADLDGEMNANVPLFVCVAESGELGLWRAALAPKYAEDSLPWFLDGSLEQEAAAGHALAETAVNRAVGFQHLAWSSPDGRHQVELLRTADGCSLVFAPAEGLEGKCVWLGGRVGRIEKGVALVRVPAWDVGPGLELAVGKPGSRWQRQPVAR